MLSHCPSAKIGISNPHEGAAVIAHPIIAIKNPQVLPAMLEPEREFKNIMALKLKWNF